MSLFFDIPESWQHDPLGEQWAKAHGQDTSDPAGSGSVLKFITGRKARLSDAHPGSKKIATQLAEVMELDRSGPLPATILWQNDTQKRTM